ncbi:hypothetical protein AB0B89_23325 [Sphaerisporangium sp. NPDC049002]|uniref:MmyB family transcriptional regulator n=1 Tax=Sphaerisporangium sp. NPDC049002 TaxID=3155392 RepID=UPI0033FA1C58
MIDRTGIRAGSAPAGREFSALWDTHHVAVRRTDVKRFLHPVVGLQDLTHG